MFFKCFLTLLLPLLCFGHSEPVLSSSSPPQVKAAGETVTLECVFHNVNASVYPISWLKETQDPNNLYQLLSRGFRTIPDRRYTVAYTPSPEIADAGLFNFHIRDLRESDSGSYMCNVHLSDVTRLEVNVLLTVAPAIDVELQSSTTAQPVDTYTAETEVKIVTTAKANDVVETIQ